jgi:FtsH-binding integral membrane protein
MSMTEVLWRSRPLGNIKAYGGLFLMCLFILLDIQTIIKRAKTEEDWDPINESLGIYQDCLLIFKFFLEILNENNKNEKKE